MVQHFTPSSQPESCQVTVDEIHKPGPAGQYRDGGDFLSIKFSQDFSNDKPIGKGSFFDIHRVWEYRGGFAPPQPWEFGTGFSNFADPGNTDISNPALLARLPSLADYGTRAWNKAKPKLEQAGAFTFLVELDDALPMLKTTANGFKNIWSGLIAQADFSKSYRRRMLNEKIMNPKGLADQFINEQFGWAPFVSDIHNMLNTYMTARDTIVRLTDSNGKRQRRRVSVLEEHTSQVIDMYEFDSVMFGLSTGMPQGMVTGPCIKTLTEDVDTSVTASGAFSVYRPEFDRGTTPESQAKYDSSLMSLQRQLTLYGLRASPINIWRIIPWTWAIDWVSNAGDYLQYVSDIWVDSLVSDYFFLMVHQRTTRTITWTVPYGSGTLNLSWSRYFDTKQRKSASSPFDFNLDWKSLSPRQLAIAAALGISRNRVSNL